MEAGTDPGGLPVSDGCRQEGRVFFTPAARLRRAEEFAAVFAGKHVLRGEHFTLHWLPNERGQPRLGLVIAKRQAKSAVLRNALKRQIREAFRLRQGRLPAVDVVLRLAKPWPPERSRVRDAEARRAWRNEIVALLERLMEKRAW